MTLHKDGWLVSLVDIGGINRDGSEYLSTRMDVKSRSLIRLEIHFFYTVKLFGGMYFLAARTCKSNVVYLFICICTIKKKQAKHQFSLNTFSPPCLTDSIAL